jgi:hypothetical protein
MGAEPADSIGQACRAEVVITILADDRALEDVVFDCGEFLGAFESRNYTGAARRPETRGPRAGLPKLLIRPRSHMQPGSV